MQWEYHQELCQVDTALPCCNDKGEQGWELCGTVPMNMKAVVALAGAPEIVKGVLMFFKRLVPVSEVRNAGPWQNKTMDAANAHGPEHG